MGFRRDFELKQKKKIFSYKKVYKHKMHTYIEVT